MDQHGASGARNTLLVALAAALLGALGMALYAGLSGAGADQKGDEPRMKKCLHEQAAPPPEIKDARPPEIKHARPLVEKKKKLVPDGVVPGGKPSLDAACGPEAGLMLRAPKPSPKRQREMRKQAEQHAQCMRDHGIDVGPVKQAPGGGVAIRLPDGFDPTSENARSAKEACADELPKPPPVPQR
jgi:hypothetical protein